ncbi:LacI family transcriptional regulator [Leisingera sp. ANG-Vp]|nr:LacI family transcriptional regulator [Leisingera sp. ANG-Vp]
MAKKTRKRVEEAMNSLRWVPSAAARAINTGRTRFVGALVPTLDNAIFARFLSKLENQLNTHRLSLVVATTGGDPQVEAEKAKTLIDIGAEGLVVSGITHGQALYDLLDRSQRPAIATSYYDPGYVLPTIGYDNAAAAKLAQEHLTGLGHQHIAVVHGPRLNNDRTEARLSGLTGSNAALELFETEISLAGGCNAARAILQGTQRPTAILCLSDVLASGVLAELHRRDLAVPRDVSVMGIDDLPGSAHIYPELTTVHLPVARMGLAAADAIAEWVETQTVPEPTLLEPSLVLRKSTARPR